MKNEDVGLNRLRKTGEHMKVNKKTLKIWEENFKKGYRFFQPHNSKALNQTPRTEREAHAQRNILRLIQQS